MRRCWCSITHNRPDRVDGPPAFKALRANGLLYVEYADGWRELYDLESDPHQLDNRVPETHPQILGALAAGLADLASCAGRVGQGALVVRILHESRERVAPPERARHAHRSGEVTRQSMKPWPVSGIVRPRGVVSPLGRDA